MHRSPASRTSRPVDTARSTDDSKNSTDRLSPKSSTTFPANISIASTASSDQVGLTLKYILPIIPEGLTIRPSQISQTHCTENEFSEARVDDSLTIPRLECEVQQCKGIAQIISLESETQAVAGVELEQVSAMDTHENLYAGNPNIQYPIRYDVRGRRVASYKCWHCPAIQHGKQKCLIHRNMHLVQRSLTCSKCSYSCDGEKLLLRHEHCHSAEYLHSAWKWQPQADAITTRRGKGIRHERSSVPRNGKKSLQVTASPQTGHELGQLQLGVLDRPSSATETNWYKCKDPKCPATSMTKTCLEKHIKMHSLINAKYHCDICTYKANKSHLMRNHFLKHGSSHKFVRGALCNGRRKRTIMHMCSICPAKYERTNDLAKHMKRHGDNSSGLKCRYCTYTVRGPKLLERHELFHTDRPKPDSVDTARKDLDASRIPSMNLNPQKIQSTDAHRYKHKCTNRNCPHTFIRKSDLTNHLKQHGIPSRYMCTKCSYGCNSLASKYAHNLKHCEPLSKMFVSRAKAIIGNNRKGSATRYRTNLLKEGLVTRKELLEIRRGNPKFTYPTTHRNNSSGNTYTLNYRCLHCPRALRSFFEWSNHQYGSHGLKKYKPKQYKCELCDYKTPRKQCFSQHIRNQCPRNENSGSAHETSNSNYTPTTRSIRKQEVTLKTKEDLMEHEDLTLKEDIIETSGTETMDDELNSVSTIHAPCYLISQIKINNLMAIQEKVIDPGTANLYGFYGSSDSQKSTTIVACLLGLGYDILLNLPENSTICGIDITDVLYVDEKSGFVEILMDLTSYPRLKKKYGLELRLRRTFAQGTKVSESSFSISYGGINSQQNQNITHEELKNLIRPIIPEFALRFMLLNAENLQFLAENFQICDEIFRHFVGEKKKALVRNVRDLNGQINGFADDLDSRAERIMFLKENMTSSHTNLPDLQQLHDAQESELKSAELLYDDVKETHDKLLLEIAVLNTKIADHVAELVDNMRVPYRKFLHTQGYMGDLVLEDMENELIIWIRDKHTALHAGNHVTIEEARSIWKSMTLGKRRLAIIGFYVAFWQVLDCCPVMFADAFTVHLNWNSSFHSLPSMCCLKLFVKIHLANFLSRYLN